MKKEELTVLLISLQELGFSHEEAAKVVCEAAKESCSIGKLSKKKNTSLLIKLGLLLIAFPDPTISDLLGTILISAGLVQRRIRQSEMHIEDVPTTFQEAIKSLQMTRKELG